MCRLGPRNRSSLLVEAIEVAALSRLSRGFWRRPLSSSGKGNQDRRIPLIPAARWGAATTRAPTVDTATSAWPLRSSTDSASPRLRDDRGGVEGDCDHRRPHSTLGYQPPPGSTPRARLPPWQRPRFQPHTRLSNSVSPNPEPSYRLVQETQAGQNRSRRTARGGNSQPLSGAGRDPLTSGNCEMGRGLRRRKNNAAEAGTGIFEKPAPDAGPLLPRLSSRSSAGRPLRKCH